jgi:hypothetical protein
MASSAIIELWALLDFLTIFWLLRACHLKINTLHLILLSFSPLFISYNTLGVVIINSVFLYIPYSNSVSIFRYYNIVISYYTILQYIKLWKGGAKEGQHVI